MLPCMQRVFKDRTTLPKNWDKVERSRHLSWCICYEKCGQICVHGQQQCGKGHYLLPVRERRLDLKPFSCPSFSSGQAPVQNLIEIVTGIRNSVYSTAIWYLLVGRGGPDEIGVSAIASKSALKFWSTTAAMRQ